MFRTLLLAAILILTLGGNAAAQPGYVAQQSDITERFLSAQDAINAMSQREPNPSAREWAVAVSDMLLLRNEAAALPPPAPQRASYALWFAAISKGTDATIATASAEISQETEMFGYANRLWQESYDLLLMYNALG